MKIYKHSVMDISYLVGQIAAALLYLNHHALWKGSQSIRKEY